MSAVITATLMSIYRVTMGGSGITAGLCGIWAYAFIGYLYHRQKDRLSRLRLVQIIGVHFGLGVLVALVSFFTFLVLPLPQRDLVMQSATLPMLLIFPAAAALTGGFMFQQDRYADTMSSLTSERKMLRTRSTTCPTTSSSKTRSCAFSSAILHSKSWRCIESGSPLGKTAAECFPSELAAHFEEDDRRVLAGEPILRQERQTVNEDGQPIVVSTTKVPFRDGNGSVVGVIGISRDVTVEKLRAEEGLQLETERQRSKILQTFIQYMSHDFRTPLSVILTSVYMLRRNLDATQHTERLDRIDRQVERITQLLDDTSMIVQLDMETAEFQFISTDIGELLRATVVGFQSRAVEKGQTLELALDSESLLADVDPRYLPVAVKHLLANAITYTGAEGKISVKARKQQDQVEISVEDNGMGIAEPDRPHIFERSYRVDRARSHGTGGVGVGLSIVRKIAEAHHGLIRFESTPLVGSTFTLCLPTVQAKRE
ncbi:MAG: PAS domain-containing protein [Chloroflexi bacterium]|nr:PAS domain-containing protein [Chloroflexota bacterium]